MFKIVRQRIYRWLAVSGNVKLGKRVHIGPMSVIWSSAGLDIGDNTYIGKFCTVQVNGRIGKGVLIANSVGIVGRLDHEYREPGIPVRDGRWIGNDQRLSKSPENTVNIGDDVWIGYGSVVLSGISIGEGSIIAAGSVVNKDVQPYSVVAGCPAREVARRFPREAEDEAEHRDYLRRTYGE